MPSSTAAWLSLVMVAMGCGSEEPTARRSRDVVSADRAVYDRWRRPEALVRALSLKPGARVADVGAGYGYLTPYLAAAIGPTGRLVATDIDAAALARLAAEARRRRISAETRLVTRTDPGLEPAAYDCILLAQVDHLLLDRAKYLRTLSRSLAPGGRIAISNRIDREPAVRAAAAAAGLHVVGRSTELPSQFLLLIAPSAAGATRRGDRS